MHAGPLSTVGVDDLLTLSVRCEVCGTEVAVEHASLVSVIPVHSQWQIGCAECTDCGYWVPLNELLRGGGIALDWLGEISGRPWNQGPHAASFFLVMARLRDQALSALH